MSELTIGKQPDDETQGDGVRATKQSVLEDVLSHADAHIELSIRAYADTIARGDSVLIVPKGLWAESDVAWSDFLESSTGPAHRLDLRGTSESARSEAHQTRGDFRTSLLGFYTSGSTGAAKTVLYSLVTILSCAAVIASELGLDATTNAICFVPHEFAFGLSIVHSHLSAGSPVRFEDFRSAEDALSKLSDRRAAGQRRMVYLLPHQAQLLCIAADGVSVDDGAISFVVAGGSLSESVATRLSAIFPEAHLFNMYGQAELGPRVSIWSGSLSAFQQGEIGSPIPGVQLSYLPLGDGSGLSELSVQSPYRMLRYLGPPDVVSRYAPEATAWGWPTGDLARDSASGSVILVGRRSQYVNVAGVRVLLADVQAAVSRVPGVNISRVKTVELATGGSVPAIEFTTDKPDPAVTRANVRKALGEAFGGVAAAFRVSFVDALEPNEAGKL